MLPCQYSPKSRINPTPRYDEGEFPEYSHVPPIIVPFDPISVSEVTHVKDETPAHEPLPPSSFDPIMYLSEKRGPLSTVCATAESGSSRAAIAP
jgi:hypothetical protein